MENSINTMKLLLESWKSYLNEKQQMIASLAEVIDFIKENPNQKIYIDCPKGTCKKFGGKTAKAMPFDYGEWTDLINPADNMGWDLIIVPSAGNKRENLIPVGYLQYAEGTGKEGNDKIIIAPWGKYSQEDLNIIEDFFFPMERFEDVRWL